MPKHQILEEEKKIKPPILFIDTNSGIKNTLLNVLAEETLVQGKLYAMSSKEVPPGVEKISPLSIHFLDKISDKLKYAVIFLDEEPQKKKVLSIIEKLSVHQTRVVLIIPYRIIERFIDVLLKVKEEKNVVVGMVGDVFGKSNPSSPISKIIKNALVNKEFLLSGNELLSIYPISDSDVVIGIQQILFGRRDPSPFYNLFYDHPQTLISLSHLLKRQEPELSIQFKNVDIGLTPEKTQREKDRYIRDRTTVKPQFLSHVFAGFEKSVVAFENETEEVGSLSKKKTKIFKKSSRFSIILRGFKYLIIAAILYVGLSIGGFLFSVLIFKNGISELSSGHIKKAQQLLITSNKLESITKNTVFLLSVLPSNLTHGKLEEELRAYDDLSYVAQGAIPFISKIQTKNPKLSKSELGDITSSVLRLYFILERSNASELKSIITSSSYKNSSALLPLLPVIPSVLGYDSLKNYLLLFQNNAELRPTGGFIGSVGYMSIKNGEMTDLNIQDVYDLDGQLKGHIEPSYVVRRYLQPHLYLRDSNFAIDFAETASTSAFIYNAEGGKKVDGVIAIDTEVLKKILQITGPIKIDGVGKVDSSNVVGLLENTIQSNFFPGSTNKKDTLKTLFNKITVILDSEKSKQLALYKSMPSLFAQKHILFSFASPSLQKAFVGAGYAGSLSDLRVQGHMLKDFLSLNEANIGVNKENRFVTRNVTYSAFLRPSVLNSEVSVSFKNEGKDPYKTYLRFVVPIDSKLLNISIDGADQKIVQAVTNPAVYEKKNFIPPTGLEVDQAISNDKKIIGFILTIPPVSENRIRVLYENTKIIPVDDLLTYSLLYIKQPGTLPYPLVIQLQTGDSYNIKNGDGSSPVLYDGNIATDKEISAKITRVKQ